jgi:tetratricopeptide (TPR) repeat protein
MPGSTTAPERTARLSSVGQAVSYVLQALKRGDADRACGVADRLLRLAPGAAAAWDVFAFAFHDRQPDRALAAARRALMLDPTCTLAAQALALHEAQTDPQRAVRRLAKGLVARPAMVTLWILLTRILWPLPMRSPFAVPERRAVLLDPGVADGWLGVGHWNQAAGERDTAVRAYLRAGVLAPDSVLPLYHLGMAAPDRVPGHAVRAVKHRFAGGAMDGFAAELAAFALANHYDAIGDEDAAFGWLQTGNGERRKRVPPEMDLNRAVLQATLEASPPRRRATAVAAGGTAAPIFIIGLPGSGTTLVESMLSRHPEVTGGGELPFVDRLAKSLAGFPTGHLDLDDDRLDDLAARYVAAVREIVDLPGRFFTDKMPNNFMHVGLIRSLFPAAPIIHLARDPMAVGWSQFRRRFETGQTYSSSLEDIAEFIAIHDRYMAHWNRLWPGGVLDLRYEALIADPEAGIRRMLDHAGLPWDPACLDHARADHRVATASATAVRGGLDKRRIEDWRRYARHLEPLRRALLRHGVAVAE